ncbi:hypothetical protein J6590_096627 [Homalodisca vitripennis]|nr:hypothetical protein J6590_096627 [Homalodisca vitripennis]
MTHPMLGIQARKGNFRSVPSRVRDQQGNRIKQVGRGCCLEDGRCKRSCACKQLANSVMGDGSDVNLRA